MYDFVESYKMSHVMQMDDKLKCEVDRFKYLWLVLKKMVVLWRTSKIE